MVAVLPLFAGCSDSEAVLLPAAKDATLVADPGRPEVPISVAEIRGCEPILPSGSEPFPAADSGGSPRRVERGVSSFPRKLGPRLHPSGKMKDSIEILRRTS
jgi:hypothetical protein